MRVLFISLFVLMFFIPSAQAEISCNTDCGKVASFTYPCPTPLNLGRKCKGRDPATYTACESTKAVACRVLKPLVNQMGKAIGRDSRVKAQAEEKGWTSASCRRNGNYLFGTIGLIYQTPMCTAVGAGVGTAACYAYLASQAVGITEIACTQLCHDKHLKDCKSSRPSPTPSPPSCGPGEDLHCGYCYPANKICQ